jgi:hypothetical protein
MAIPGRKRPSYTHAKKTWALDHDQFNVALDSAFNDMRLYLRRFGLANPSDLETK